MVEESLLHNDVFLAEVADDQSHPRTFLDFLLCIFDDDH